MVRLVIVLGSGSLNGLFWAWLASLLLPPTYAISLGVVAGLMAMLLLATLNAPVGVMPGRVYADAEMVLNTRRLGKPVPQIVYRDQGSRQRVRQI